MRLESKFFVVLDKKATGDEYGRDQKVVLCKIGDAYDRGDEVHCILWDASTSTLTLGGIEWGDFENYLEAGEYAPDL